MTLPWDRFGEPPIEPPGPVDPPPSVPVVPPPSPSPPVPPPPVDVSSMAEDLSGRELVKADAKSRSWRTLIQGLIFDVIAGVVATVALLAGADLFQRETWIAFAVLLTKSVVSAVISYFMRLKVTPTMRTEGERYAVVPLPRPIAPEERNTIP